MTKGSSKRIFLVSLCGRYSEARGKLFTVMVHGYNVYCMYEKVIAVCNPVFVYFQYGCIDTAIISWKHEILFLYCS